MHIERAHERGRADNKFDLARDRRVGQFAGQHRHFKRRGRAKIVEQGDQRAAAEMRLQLLQHPPHCLASAVETHLFLACLAMNAKS